MRIYKTIALVTSSLAVFFTAFMSSALNVALPTISQEFGADAILLSWMVTSYILAIAVCSVPLGRIADIIGIKKTFIYGTLIYTATSALALFAYSSIMLIVCRFIQGIGAAMVVVNSLAMLTAIYSAKERGRALGIYTGCVYAGSSVGPSLGGILTEHLGWRSIFLINIPTGLIIILLLFWKIKGDWCESRGEKFDYVGSIVYGFALIALMYGFSILPEISGAILILIGIIGLLVLIRWESRTQSPVLNLSIFQNNKAFLFSNLATLINHIAIFALAFLLSLYLQYIKGLTPAVVGLILVTQPVIQAVLSLFTGRLSDRIEPRIVSSAGMSLICIGLFSFIFLTENSSLAQIVIALLIMGIGIALFSSPNVNAIMSSVAPRFYGVASAIMNTTRTIGNTFSMGITVIVMAIIIGRVVITPDYYSHFLTSTKIVFGIFTVICFGGIFAALVGAKPR